MQNGHSSSPTCGGSDGRSDGNPTSRNFANWSLRAGARKNLYIIALWTKRLSLLVANPPSLLPIGPASPSACCFICRYRISLYWVVWLFGMIFDWILYIRRDAPTLSHVSLKCTHIVVRLPSPCRSCNIKLQSRVNNLHITIYPLIKDCFRSGLI
jgi:hypothetical protein